MIRLFVLTHIYRRKLEKCPIYIFCTVTYSSRDGRTAQVYMTVYVIDTFIIDYQVGVLGQKLDSPEF